jgi:ActR/RegA family two-component response regulator
MLPSDSRRDYRFIAADATPETASRTLRRDPVWPTTAAAAMPELSVVVVATDNEQRTRLQRLVDATGVARTVLTCDSFPVAAPDPVTKRVQAADPDVTLIDIPSGNPDVALRAIELLHQELPDTAIFAIAYLSVMTSVIVKAMRAGAREFLERPTTTDELVRAFARTITAPRPRSKRLSERGVHHRQVGQSDYQRVKADLHRKILDRLDLEKLRRTIEVARVEARILVRNSVNNEAIHLSVAERERLSREILDEIFGLGPREPLVKVNVVQEPRRQPVVKESPRERIREGMHVKVGPTRPDGKPHPHAGKTGRITKFRNCFTDQYWPGPSSAMIKLDAGIEPRGFICVSLECLEALPENARGEDS